MIIELELNRIKVKKELPTNWSEITFSQFLKLDACQKDYVKVFSLFLGVEEDIIRKAKITGLDQVLLAMAFLSQDPDISTIPKTILGYKVPADLGFETIGQYMDLRKDVENSRGLTHIEQLERYTLYCAMYACNPYDWKKAEEMASQFLNAPAPEVLAIGNFTLLKLVGLSLPINLKSQSLSYRFKKFKLALRIWLRNSAVMLRFYTWNAIRSLTGTK